jgi:PAS domain S-box-containing protein
MQKSGEGYTAVRNNGAKLHMSDIRKAGWQPWSQHIGESISFPSASSQAIDAATQHLAAIVESSDDAILTKDLNSIIMSWNMAAERLFGYSAEEMIGKPVTLLIPEDRHDEEPVILERLRRGERIQHYETVRRRKDGSLIDISLSVSPLRDANGIVIGASKIARDITESKQAKERMSLLLREMNHRLKNLFTIASSIVSLSAREVNSAQDLALLVQDRLTALARAHALTLPAIDSDLPPGTVSFHELIRIILAPYDRAGKRLTISGPDTEVAGNAVTSLALILHELATNAAKYGALSTSSGMIDIRCSEDGEQVILIWNERGGPPVDQPADEGFGSLLGRIAAKGHLAGSIEREWQQDGLTVRLTAARSRLSPVNGSILPNRTE